MSESPTLSTSIITSIPADCSSPVPPNFPSRDDLSRVATDHLYRSIFVAIGDGALSFGERVEIRAMLMELWDRAGGEKRTYSPEFVRNLLIAGGPDD